MYSAEDFRAVDSGKYGYSHKHVEFINEKNILPTFNKITFTYQDYLNLSPEEKRIIGILNEMGSDTVAYDCCKDISIKKDAERIFRIAVKTKEKLDREYRNGYKLVGVGNSPSALVETMHDLLGADAVTLPFSIRILTDFEFPFEYMEKNILGEYRKFTAGDWENYLKFFGIDKNLTKRTGKTLIFTDFVSEGNTRYCIESLLRGLRFDKDTKFTEIFDLMPCKIGDAENGVLLPDDNIDLHRYIEGFGLKRYAKKPGIRYYFNYENIIKNPEYYISRTEPESLKFKLFRCALYDLVSKKKNIIL